MSKGTTYAERVEKMEQTLQMIQMTVGSALQQIQQSSNAQTEILGNLLKVLVSKGVVTEAELQAQVDLTRKEAAEQRLRESREQVDRLVKDGMVKAVPAFDATKEQIVVVATYDKEGVRVLDQIVDSGSIAPPVKAQLTGKAVGESVVIPSGAKIEVLEIYESVPKEEAAAALAAAEAAKAVAETKGETA